MPSASSIAVQLFVDEATVRAEYSMPVFVWEGAHPAPAESILKTRAGYEQGHGRGGEAVVFKVEKRPKKVDAFAMGITLGHADNNDIVLADPTVSRFHAYLPLDPAGKSWKIVDADSRHGVWVDDVKAAPNKPLELPSKAKVRLGQASLRFLLPDDFFVYLRTGK